MAEPAAPNGDKAQAAPPGWQLRRYPRLNIALDVSFAPATASSAPPEQNLHDTVSLYLTTDISAGGIALYTDELYPVGTTLFCKIKLLDRPEPVKAYGTVAWFHRVAHEAHGYQMGIEFTKISTEDRGAIMRLVQEPPRQAPALSRKILLVDDDKDLQEALRVRFESAGFHVLLAADGLDGIAKGRTEHPSLIILDLLLPKLNGYDLCRLLKFDRKYAHIPIILFTARSRREDVEFGYAVGADAYVTKPFAGSTLLEKVDELLAKQPAK